MTTLLSYSSYKNDIELFKSEEYYTETTTLFYNFVKEYKDVEMDDAKKNVFHHHKYSKINKEPFDKNAQPVKQKWACTNPKNDTDKISILIITYFNKISNETYEKISNEFINELLLIENTDLFSILSKEIINKCLYDDKYRNLYINLCYKIWSNNNFILFKSFFLNYIQKLFIEKDLLLSGLVEEEIILKKKKFFTLIEIISILFNEKYIPFDIIIFVIIDLLHLNNNFIDVYDIEYEGIYILLKNINILQLNEYTDIFNYFIKLFNTILNNNKSLNKRTIFILEDIITFLHGFINGEKKICINEDEFMDKINSTDVKELCNLFKKVNISAYDSIFLKMLDIYISSKNINQKIIDIIFQLNRQELFYKTIKKILEDIEDILLDIPLASKRLIYIVDYLKYNFKEDTKIINYLKECDVQSHDS